MVIWKNCCAILQRAWRGSKCKERVIFNAGYGGGVNLGRGGNKILCNIFMGYENFLHYFFMGYEKILHYFDGVRKYFWIIKVF